MLRYLLPICLLACTEGVNLSPMRISAASKGQVKFALENKYDNTGPGATGPEYAYETYKDLNEALTAYLDDPDTKLPLFDRSRAIAHLYKKINYFDNLVKNTKLKINRPKNVPIVTSSYSRPYEHSKVTRYFEPQREERYLVPLKDVTFDFIKPIPKQEEISSSSIEYHPIVQQDIEYHPTVYKDGQFHAKVLKQQPIEVHSKVQQQQSIDVLPKVLDIEYHPKLNHDRFKFQLNPALNGKRMPWTYYTSAEKYEYRPHPDIEFLDTHDKETGDLKSAQELRDGSGAVHGYYSSVGGAPPAPASAPPRPPPSTYGQASSNVAVVQEHQYPLLRYT